MVISAIKAKVKGTLNSDSCGKADIMAAVPEEVLTATVKI